MATPRSWKLQLLGAAVVVLGSTLAFGCAPGVSDPNVPDPVAPSPQEQLTDALFAEWSAPDTPGCSVGIVRDGELVFARGYGSANLDFGIPLDENSVFYIASTSKQFTAAAVARLVLDGRVALDDDVRSYVPELPDLGQFITVSNLLHHTSGIRDYLTLMDIADRSVEDFFSNADAIALLSRQRALNFEPGSEYLYSNSNYVLLAEIVERVSGQSLQEFSAEHFFEPLGMSATHWGEDRTKVVPHRVTSYSLRDDGGYRRWVKNFHGKGDGNLLTTVQDLARWDGIFYSDDPTWSELASLMLTRGQLNDGESIDYALGLGHGEYRDRATVSHGGGFLGFRTQMMRFPEDRFTAICLCSLGAINPSRLSQKLADIWLFEDEGVQEIEEPETFAPATEEPAAWNPDAAELAAYAGTYYSPELDSTMTLLVREGQLLIADTGEEPEALEPQEPGVLGLDGVSLTFERSGQRVTGFSLNAGRVRDLHFERR